MSLLGRNVTGDDVLALWKHIDRNGPVGRLTLVQRYYPGDAEDPDQSNSRKLLEDAISFLEESDQVTEQDNEYTISDEYSECSSPRVAILKGLNAQAGEDSAYIGALEALTEDDVRYFDSKNQLNDLLSERLSSVNWTDNKINYWERTMSTLGVLAPVNSDSEEGYTHVLSLSQTLLLDILKDAFPTNEPIQLESVMDQISETYLPVYATKNRNTVATYFERALLHASSNNSIELDQSSDFGETVEIGGSGYNAIVLRVENN